jgi:siroheme synthase
LLSRGLPADMPCVAVKDASRPEAAYTASQLSGLADLHTSQAPTLLLVGQAFASVLSSSLDTADFAPACNVGP